MRRVPDTSRERPVSLPAVGTLVNEPAYAGLVSEFGRERVVEAIRQQIQAERKGDADGSARQSAVAQRLRSLTPPRLRRVINATGGILHTHLRRAPLSTAAVDSLGVAARYT